MPTNRHFPLSTKSIPTRSAVSPRHIPPISHAELDTVTVGGLVGPGSPMGTGAAAARAVYRDHAAITQPRCSLNHTAPLSRPPTPGEAGAVILGGSYLLHALAIGTPVACCRMAACYTRLQFIGTTVTWRMAACYKIGGEHKDAC
eukprot:scaffold19221_cov60-Phaeocystis_antarctica.AAC.2